MPSVNEILRQRKPKPKLEVKKAGSKIKLAADKPERKAKGK